MTLKLDGDIDILKTHLHTQKEVARSSNAEVIALINTKIRQKARSNVINL